MIWIVEVMGLHTNDAKVLHETFVVKVMGSRSNNAKVPHKTFFVEVTDSNPVWEWTQQQANPKLLEGKEAKGKRADITRLLCFGPCQLNGWVFDESVLLLWISLSCPWLLNITPVDERLPGSKNASCPNHLVGLQLGLLLGAFFGLLIGYCNQIKWLTRTLFPATELRLVNAFAWLAKRKSANSTKNLERAITAVQSFLFSMLQLFL